MQERLYVDVESLGLMGKIKLIQYSLGMAGKIIMFRPDREPEELEIFKKLLYDKNNTCVIFNLPFDIFKCYQLFGTEKKIESTPLDLHLHAKLHHPIGPYTFQRKGDRAIAALSDIPAEVVEEIGEFICTKIQKLVPKTVEVSYSEHKTKRKRFKRITFGVTANLRLKTLMLYYGEKVRSLKELWPVPNKKEEEQTNPFEQEVHRRLEPECDAILDDKNHEFWKYAEDDIKFLKILDRELGFPKSDYNDEVAHIVGFTKMKGFQVDHEILKELIASYEKEIAAAKETLPFDIMSSKQKLEHFSKKHPLAGLTNCDKKVLKKLAKMGDEEAKMLQNLGTYKQQLDQAIKLSKVKDKRLHPDFRVLGTATQRMAGAGGFNTQGIGKKSPIRKAILTSCGGDFSGLEIGLMAVIYNDRKLQEELEAGRDIHLSTAINIQKELKRFSYEAALQLKKEADALRADQKTKDHKLVEDLRGQTKMVVFGSAYGAASNAISDLTGLNLEKSQELLDAFYEHYSDMKEFKEGMENEFCTGDTKTWSRDSISLMARETTDMLGFTRKFYFEYEVAKLFWDVAQLKSNELDFILVGHEDQKIIRKEMKGPQTFRNAIKSAFLGAALTIQKSVARSATNSIVQSVGAQLTKRLMVRIWKKFEEPTAMIQIHDEVLFGKEYKYISKEIARQVQVFIVEWKKMFKYLSMDFADIDCWADR